MKEIKISFYLVFIALLCINCSNDDDGLSDITSQMQVKIDGDTFDVTDTYDGYLISGNTNCDYIHIVTRVHTNQNPNIERYDISFNLLKNGEIKRIEVLEIPKNNGINKLYLTLDFNPKSTVQITNFSYNDRTNDVSFDFSATLFLDNQPNSQNRKTIEGNIDLKSFKDIECQLDFIQSIYYQSANFQFNTIRSIQSNQANSTSQKHSFYSNNGYRIIFKTNDDLWNYEIGNYSFNQNSNVDYVSLEKYIGEPIATQLEIINDNDWEKFECEGYFTIGNKDLVNSSKVISGKMNVNAWQDNQLVFEISNMEFFTGSFE